MSARDNRTRAGAKDPWGREAEPLAQRHAEAPTWPGLRAWSADREWTHAKGEDKRVARRRTGRVSAFSVRRVAGRQVAPDRLALKPYWGKPTVRNFREGDGNVGIIRSPIRAIALPDRFSDLAVVPCGPGRIPVGTDGQATGQDRRGGTTTCVWGKALRMRRVKKAPFDGAVRNPSRMERGTVK
jgi:hypothetical protein